MVAQAAVVEDVRTQTQTPTQQLLAAHMRERDLLAAIVQLARAAGWHAYHTWRSDHSAAGFPDLVLCKPPRLLFVECKTARGKLSAEQLAWISALASCVPGVEFAGVVRPRDWLSGDVERWLLGGKVCSSRQENCREIHVVGNHAQETSRETAMGKRERNHRQAGETGKPPR